MARPIKPALNSQHTDGWLKPIGKLVMNFAAIELHTFWWLGLLGKDVDLPKQALGWPFKARVDKLMGLIDIVEDQRLREQCISCWKQTLEAAKFRNAVVHNPIVFGWTSKDESGEPDVIGIPDVSHLGDKPRLASALRH